MHCAMKGVLLLQNITLYAIIKSNRNFIFKEKKLWKITLSRLLKKDMQMNLNC